jgi:hypothetical protein
MVERGTAMTDVATVLPRRARPRGGPDRVTVMLLSLTGFLAVLALLAAQLRATPPAAAAPTPRVVVLRRIYRTTIVEDGLPAGRGGAATVSVSTSGASSAASSTAAPTTRTSAHP